MRIEARQIQETLYSYAAILNFTPSPQGMRAKFGACSVKNAQLLFHATLKLDKIMASICICNGKDQYLDIACGIYSATHDITCMRYLCRTYSK